MNNLEEMYSRMMLEEEEEGRVVVGQEEVTQAVNTYVLVGNFFTEKNINFQAIRTF